MIVDYQEAAVLTRVPVAGRMLTLDDLHKHAWTLFCDGPRDRKLTTRPFIFRFEPFDDRRMLLTLRSDRPFAGSQARRVAFEAGDRIECDYAFVPTRRNENTPRTPPGDEWVPLGVAILERGGLNITDTPDERLLGYWKKYAQQRGPIPVLTMRCRAAIARPETFASTFLDGIGRRRGFGLGMIRLAPDSAIQPQKAA